jgi:eukaryotic-like serine/threonine-protein kinase
VEIRRGEVIGGRFAIDRLAGSGGMGAVYRAVDRRDGAVVALKLLHGYDARAAERFANEASVLSQLAHPGIVGYVDHGATLEGQPFLAMEWIDGEDLGARLARGEGARLGVAASVALVRAVAAALGAAHAGGIVHRDLKPSNVMLVGGALDRVKVLDFGIARSAHATRALTATGVVMGTPGYMAPEQLRSTRRVDARADVFALGALLYECLTGRPAFAGDHPLAILAKLLLEEAPRAGEIDPAVPPALDALLARMLAKDPDARPADAAAVAAELASIEGDLGSEPVAHLEDHRGGGPEGASSVLPGGAALTRSEQRLLCFILAAAGADSADGPTAPTVAASAVDHAERELAEALALQGARAEWLPGGVVLVALEGGGSATDQAARAARCALSLRRMLPEMPIALVTGRGDARGSLPVGAVIDRAAELLEGARGRSGVVLDTLTRALLDVRFDVAEGPRGLELLDERAIGEETRTLLGRPSPCVGRDRELRALGDLLEECVEEGVARVALVTAPPGAGKSRLRSELCRRVRREHPEVTLWAGRGDLLGTGSAFGLIASALRGAAGILGGEPLEERRAKLAARVALHVAEPERARVAEFLGEIVGAPFPDEASPRLQAARGSAGVMADQIRVAWQALVSAECAAGPLLLVLEDLHWGDLPSIKLVDLALRELSGRPLMVLALARPEVHEVFPRLWAERDRAEIRLGELTRRAAESLVRHALGAAASAPIVAALVDRAGGNAFYLEELIRAVAEGHGDALPDTVLAMAESRLLALPAEARRVLRAASVFGELFWEGAVTSLLGGGEARGTEASSARAVLAELVDREVVLRREASAFPGEVEYGFRHALLRDGAYAMLGADDRALGHRLAAAWLTRAGEGDPMVLAGHHERGGEPARAVSFFRRAAEQALRGHDLDGADARAARGLACGATGQDEVALLLVHAAASSWRGDFDAAERHAGEVLARATPGTRAWYWALAGRAAANGFRGRTDRLLESLTLAAGVDPTPDGAPGLVAALGALTPMALAMGQVDVGVALLDRMEQIGAGIAERDPLCRAWLDNGRSARAHMVEGDVWVALVLLRRAVEGFAEAGDRRYLALMRQREGELYLALGALVPAEDSLRAALASQGQTGLGSGRTRMVLAAVLLQRGAVDEAIALATGLLTDPIAQQGMAGRTPLLVVLSSGHLARGDLAAAEGMALAAIASAREGTLDRRLSLSALADVRLAQGRPAEALAAAREGLAGAPARPHDTVRSRLLLAEALALGGAEGAAALAAARDRLLEGAGRIGDPELQRSYLELIPVHARTLMLAR